MILYTPLRIEDIFTPNPSDYTNRQLISVNGKMVEAEKAEDGSYRIIQLLSTDPQDFLNSSLMPGTIISR
ncbi:YlzJ-like family protein [Sediminibacillus massiliensis]|uniref:YlzJ-like family protein n=1 Tax=Sediminibacillus massiliensis TaxID=1926277 RepID=UPI0009887155|nr:YlzJ-like family protein [Sediminibacillus massiliensis]